MKYAPSPLAVVEREFHRLAPDHLVLHGTDVNAWLEDRPYTLLELRGILMREGTPYEVRDGVWRKVIRAARLSGDWMVGALGLCMPALRAVSRRASRGLGAGAVDEVESAAVAAVVAEVRVINLDYARLAWYLRCRAQRGVLRARKRELAAPAAVGPAGQERKAETQAEGHPDLVLAQAVRAGVLSAVEAHLIGETRLGSASLAQAAVGLGISYKAAAKRRERAEARLVTAVLSGRVSAAGLRDRERGAPAPSPVAPVLTLTASRTRVSHPRGRRAS